MMINSQDHYDYGLRNLKAVLNMAGALKRADPNMNEEAILMRALRYFTPLKPVSVEAEKTTFPANLQAMHTSSLGHAFGGFLDLLYCNSNPKAKRLGCSDFKYVFTHRINLWQLQGTRHYVNRCVAVEYFA